MSLENQKNQKRARPPMPLFVGAQNDSLYLLDKPPNPAPYDGPIPKHYGPSVVISGFPNNSDDVAQQMADYSQSVDEYVRQVEAERDLLLDQLADAVYITKT